MDCSTPGFPVHHQLPELKLMSITSVMPSNYLIPYCCLHLPPSIFLSIMVFPNESVLRIRQPKYWSFSFSISHSNEYSGLISFRMDWKDLLAFQGTLKSLLQQHSSKVSILSDCQLNANLVKVDASLLFIEFRKICTHMYLSTKRDSWPY